MSAPAWLVANARVVAHVDGHRCYGAVVGEPGPERAHVDFDGIGVKWMPLDHLYPEDLVVAMANDRRTLQAAAQRRHPTVRGQRWRL